MESELSKDPIECSCTSLKIISTQDLYNLVPQGNHIVNMAENPLFFLT